MAKIENVEKKQFPPEALDRLKAADAAISAMADDERVAAFEWLRVKFRDTWPSSGY